MSTLSPDERIAPVSMPHYTRCKWCGHRWLGCLVPFVLGEPTPGKDLKCPECGLAGSSIVLDFEPHGQLL